MAIVSRPGSFSTTGPAATSAWRSMPAKPSPPDPYEPNAARRKKHHAQKSLVNGFAVPALVVVVVLGATTPARAGQIFAFNYSLPGAGATPMAVSASGFFATTDLVGNSYTITGAWGNWNGAAITGVLAPGGFGNDNLLFSSGPLLDINGVGFMVNAPGDSGTGSVNVYYNGEGYTENSLNIDQK